MLNAESVAKVSQLFGCMRKTIEGLRRCFQIWGIIWTDLKDVGYKWQLRLMVIISGFNTYVTNVCKYQQQAGAWDQLTESTFFFALVYITSPLMYSPVLHYMALLN